MNRQNYQSYSILAKDHFHPNDTWETHLNNNMLCIGPTGAGKTRNVVMPNLLQCNASYVVMDTKGSLYHQIGPALREHGYEVLRLNFLDLEGSVGYNPLDHIRYNEHTGCYEQQDILGIAEVLCPSDDHAKEPFWAFAAQNYMACLISYCLEALPEEQHTLTAVFDLFQDLQSGRFSLMIDDLEVINPGSWAVRLYQNLQTSFQAEKMHGSICGIIASEIAPLTFNDALELYCRNHKLRFESLAERKMAIFVTTSDIDRSLDKLSSLFVSQSIHALCRLADRSRDYMLPWPVRFFLDDFCNLYIKNFPDIISVIRSREIYCSIFCQTLTQLEGRYGEHDAMSIVGNCDEQIVLAFQDNRTASYYAEKADRTIHTLQTTPLDKAWLFVRGKEAEIVEPYDVTSHINYRDPERYVNAEFACSEEKEGEAI